MLFAHVLALAIWLHQAHEAKTPQLVCHAALVWPHDDLSGDGQAVRVCWVEEEEVK